MKQGKNKRSTLTFDDNVHNCTLSVDSEEEQDFLQWLVDAHDLSIIHDFEYQPESYVLTDNVHYTDVFGKERTLFQGHRYSADFIVSFNPTKHMNLAKEFHVPYNKTNKNECSVVIDTKGTFNRNARSFSTDRKWVYDKFKVFVNEVVIPKFFAKFGCPEKCKLTKKTKKPRKCFLGLSSIIDMFK